MNTRTGRRPTVVKRAGGPDKVVLVHGSLDRHISFRQVAAHLPDWTVVGYDRRGWGGSRALGDATTTLEDHVEDLTTILAAHPGAVVAGHSYGGLVALCAAARSPELVRAVVAYEPPVRWLPWWPPTAPWEQLVRDAEPHGPAAVAEELLRAVTGRPPATSRRQLEEDGAALVTEMGDHSLDTPLFDPVALDVPVVVGAGADTLPHHRETALHLAALAPAGRFREIAGAGHAAHVTHPAAFAELITLSGGIST
ncbi:alpha/beta hydrolase [Actinosynnema sp. NPDC050801]|uniref:alpha/beta fold hydrolase n=1 Tax=unclassified Actinosynnema TaxID=2637065 RepID=UPI0033F64A68